VAPGLELKSTACSKPEYLDDSSILGLFPIIPSIRRADTIRCLDTPYASKGWKLDDGKRDSRVLVFPQQRLAARSGGGSQEVRGHIYLNRKVRSVSVTG